MNLFDIAGWLAAAEGRVLSGFRWPLLTGAVALAVTWFITPYVRNLAVKRGAVDDPKRDDRRIHREPLPRWGGIGIFAGIFVALALVLPFAYHYEPFPRYLIAMMALGALLVVFGALDDLYEFSAKIQALALLIMGIAVQFFYDHIGRVQIATVGVPLVEHRYLDLGHGLLAIFLTTAYIFVITKTMDTIDGVDGLAASIATIAATTLTIIAAYGEQPRVAIVAAAIGGAGLGFLKHNYNPAKIIMGTGGSQLLGFLLGCLTIVGALKTAAAVALFIPILVFGVPITDAFVVVIRRALSGQPITQGDKRHFHHTLLNKGLSQRQTVFVLAIAACLLCAVLLVVVKAYGR